MSTDFGTYRTDDIIGSLKATRLLKPYDVMVTGVTGAGKSTTINALLKQKKAKVGIGVDPETKILEAYALGHFIRLWDTPGLGDGTAQDKENIKRISYLLDMEYLKGISSYTLNQQGFGDLEKWVDTVLIVIEGSNKDMGMTYKLINEVIKHKVKSKKILVAVNQADIAMKGRGWNRERNAPDAELQKFLDEQAASVQRRIKETTDLNLPKPLYYSAEYGYNVDKLLDTIINNMATQEQRKKADETQANLPN